MDERIAGEFVHSLDSLINPYVTNDPSQRLHYDNRHPDLNDSLLDYSYQPVRPEEIVVDLIGFARGEKEKNEHATQLREAGVNPTPDPNSLLEDRVAAYFALRCNDEKAIVIAANTIRYDSGNGAWGRRWQDITIANGFPLDMGPEFQRKLFRAAVVRERDAVQRGLDNEFNETPGKEKKMEKDEQKAVEDAQKRVKALEDLLGKIDEKVAEQPAPGQLV